MSRYIDGSKIAECRDLLRQGVRLSTLADRLQVNEFHLAGLLGVKESKPEPVAASLDLWAADASRNVL